MASFDPSQLKPQERRLVVIGLAILFVVLNMWFIWPHYGDLARVQRQVAANQKKLDTYQAEFARTNTYLAELRELEREGAVVLSEDKDIALLSTVQSLVRRSGVNTGAITPTTRGSFSATNDFFDQRALAIVLQPNSPDALINFLESLATNDVVMRVKELDLRPDPTQSKLAGNVRVIASFQRKGLTTDTSPRSRPSTPRS